MAKKWLNRQQIFETAYRGLKSQGFIRSMKKCSDGGYSCCFIGAAGRHCAIGWLMLGSDVDTGSLDDVRSTAGIRLRDVDFARKLMWAHDCNHTPEMMRNALAALADKYKLKIPETR